MQRRPDKRRTTDSDPDNCSFQSVVQRECHPSSKLGSPNENFLKTQKTTLQIPPTPPIPNSLAVRLRNSCQISFPTDVEILPLNEDPHLSTLMTM